MSFVQRDLIPALCVVALVTLASAFTPAGTSGPPPNDNCADAISIGLGGTAFTNLGATQDGSAGCTGTDGQDVWFHYTSDYTGTLLVSTCGSADFDTLLSAYSGGSCPPGAELACNDQACASDQSEITFAVTAGQEYIIRVTGWDGAQGSGTLNLSPDSVSNDDCANAISIGLGGTPFTTLSTTQDGSAGCTGTPGPDVWFHYTAGFSGSLVVTTCGSADFDTVLSAYDGNSCPPGAELACDDQACASDQSEITFAVTAGQEYTIRVAGWNGDQGSGMVQLAQLGDTCGFPFPATDGAYPGNTDDNHALDGVTTPCASGSDPIDEWYRYIATCTGVATATTCHNTVLDTTLAIYDDCGGPLIRCDDQDVCDGLLADQELVRWQVTAGEDYYIRVSGWNSATGSYELDISCNDCPADFVEGGDGIVDVSELLDVLGTWGPCADCPEDINGDDVVDVLDLLLILGAWGPC